MTDNNPSDPSSADSAASVASDGSVVVVVDDDDASASATAAGVDLLDTIVSHPYLEERYPERPRTLRDILRYEEETLESFRQQFSYRVVSKWDDDTPNSGRVRTLAIGQNNSFTFIISRDTNAEQWNVPDDLAIFDKTRILMVNCGCRSFPDTIRHLVSLERITIVGPHHDFTVPSGAMTTLTNVETVNSSASNGGTVRQFFDLPNVKRLSIMSRVSDEKIRIFVDSFLASIADIQSCSFRNSVIEFPKFPVKIFSTLSTDERLNLHRAILQAFPNINKILVPGFESSLKDCRFVSLIEELRAENFAMDLKSFRFTLESVCTVKGLEQLIRLAHIIGENINLEFEYCMADPLKNLSAEEKMEREGPKYKNLSRNFLFLVNSLDGKLVHCRGLGGQDKVPLSLWAFVLERANRPIQSFRTLRVPAAVTGSNMMDIVRLQALASSDLNEKESKAMSTIPASTIYSLLREGLVLQDSWRDQLLRRGTASLRSSCN